MKILSCSLKNFGSYKSLDFDFQDQGLTLIQGPTGSGKSTLMDAIPWILFGITAKGGKVDEIRSWNAQGTSEGTICLDNDITITRTRNPNDLLWRHIASTEPIRGRDLADTQKIINQKLGMDADLYLSGAYFHEFSQTASFFTTTAKNRRMICEQIVDLSLATKIQASASEKNKSLNKYVTTLETESMSLASNIALLQRMEQVEASKASRWEEQQQEYIHQTKQRYEAFEANRKKTVSKQCKTCGTILEKPKEVTDTSENPYVEKLESLLKETNPYTSGVKDFSKELKEYRVKLDDVKKVKASFKKDATDIELLQDAVQIFRGELIKNTIGFIETNTNKLLTKYFDAEINVRYNVQDADKLDVEILKDGNEASFTQLSKGQRQLLKLCFGVSIMEAVQNQHSVNFEQIFLDEALDGLDESLKIRAYRLLEDLAVRYNSVFVVEHSAALKTLFNNSYEVALVNGNSEICQA
jgi:DNA repair exonuclease SbcCD ATPase subunit